MKKFFMIKKNLAMMAVIVGAVIIGVWCLVPDSGVNSAMGSESLLSGADFTQRNEASIPGETASPADDSIYDPYSSYGNESTEQVLERNSADDPYENTYNNSVNNIGGNGSGNESGNGNEQPENSSALTVTLSIDCYTILGNMENLKGGKESFVGNGVIMNARTIAFTEGETVFDLLYRECRSSGIHMSSRFTPIYNSAYIEGINQLYEFDCGELSGWMYKVNGWFPNYGCSHYYIQDGDVIEWRYTCDLGVDIGGDYATQG